MKPKADFEINSLSTLDLRDIIDIERASFSDPWSENALLSSITGPYCLTAAARKDGRVIGYIMGMALYEDCEITNVAVLPEYRSRGAAKAMMESFLSLCRERSVERVLLEVRESNAPAIGLYSAFGFKPYGRRKEYYKEPTEDALLMVVELK